jgi:hypothetical protein
MSNQDPPPHTGIPWPPPSYVRAVAAVFTAGAATAGFAGYAMLAGALAATATVILVIDLTTARRLP